MKQPMQTLQNYAEFGTVFGCLVWHKDVQSLVLPEPSGRPYVPYENYTRKRQIPDAGLMGSANISRKYRDKRPI